MLKKIVVVLGLVLLASVAAHALFMPASPRVMLRGTVTGISPRSGEGCIAGLQMLDGQWVTVWGNGALACNGLSVSATQNRPVRVHAVLFSIYSAPDVGLFVPVVERVQLMR